MANKLLWLANILAIANASPINVRAAYAIAGIPVPGANTVAIGGMPMPGSNTVTTMAAGETFEKLAASARLHLSQISAANPGIDLSTVKPGQVVTIPSFPPAATQATSVSTTTSPGATTSSSSSVSQSTISSDAAASSVSPNSQNTTSTDAVTSSSSSVSQSTTSADVAASSGSSASQSTSDAGDNPTSGSAPTARTLQASGTSSADKTSGADKSTSVPASDKPNSASATGKTSSASTIGTASSASTFGTASSAPAVGTNSGVPTIGTTSSAPTIGTASSAPAVGTNSGTLATGKTSSASATDNPTSAPAVGTNSGTPATGKTSSASATDNPTNAPTSDKPTSVPASGKPTSASATDKTSGASTSDKTSSAPGTDQTSSGTVDVPDVTVTGAPAVNSVASTSGGKSNEDAYTFFKGDGSTGAGWPTKEKWIAFEEMFSRNLALMGKSCVGGVTPNTDAESQSIKTIIVEVASKAKIDPRFVLAVIMQESNGCVRIQGTPSGEAGVFNPGLMQSFKGKGTCNIGNSKQVTPCGVSDIKQMLIDGTQGTEQSGTHQAGLVQHVNDVGGDASGQAYYKAARKYNSGSVSKDGVLETAGKCTPRSFGVPCYSSDIANRMMGWVSAPTKCELKPETC